VFVAEVRDGSSGVELLAILRQGKEDFVEDRDVGILEGLRSRLDEFDSTGECVKEGASIDKDEVVDCWVKLVNLLNLREDGIDLLGWARRVSCW